MILLTVAISHATKWEHYVIVTTFLGVTLIFSKLPLMSVVKEMKPLFFLFVVMLLLNRWHLAGRLTLMLMCSLLMIGTTPLSTLRNTIQWYLRPVPFISEVQVATIVNLIFVLVPMIFHNHMESMNSQKARCVQLRKHPVQKVKLATLPLLNRTLKRADALMEAMEARCYSLTRTGGLFKTKPTDWLLLFFCFSLLFGILVTS